MKKIITLILIGVFAGAFSQESFTIENLTINTKYSDFGATYYKDGQLIFASPKQSRRIWKQNNQPYLDLFVAKENDSLQTFENSTSFSKTINTRYHEATVAFTKDYSTVYFTRDNYIHGKLGAEGAEGKVNLKLYKAELVNDEWTNIVELPFNSDFYSTGHPTLSKDEKKLYFSSDRPEGYGLTDIYVVDILENNQYSAPRNLGETVNSSSKDEFPFIDENSTLYFSSNREKGYGGLDIYYSLFSNEEFTMPKNMGVPLNSISDDFAFVKKQGANMGYISSNRYGGVGDDDIYAFQGQLPEKCESEVEITVVDQATNTPISGANVKVTNAKGSIVTQTITTANGIVSFNSDCKKSYTVVTSKENYNASTKKVITSKGKVALGLNIQEKPKPVVKQPSILDETDVNYDNTGRLVINIENIYYDTNKANIRFLERKKLDRLVDIMTKYPNIKVEIGSHTDCRGSNSYNMKLSDRRAVSAQQYVISRGISSNRIFGRGYGESNPVNNCNCSYKCSKQEYQENRRTEFVVIEQ